MQHDREAIKEIRFQIEGIVCSGCVLDMENLLKDVDGIVDAAINYTDGVLTVKFDPAEINAKGVFLRVRKLGYETTVLQ